MRFVWIIWDLRLNYKQYYGENVLYGDWLRHDRRKQSGSHNQNETKDKDIRDMIGELT